MSTGEGILTRQFRRLRWVVSNFTSPPLWGAVIGIVAGLTPGIKRAFSYTTLARGGLEGVASEGLRLVADTATLVGGAALGLQALVLSGSLARSFFIESSGGIGKSLPTRREWRAIAPVFIARNLISPAIVCAGMLVLHGFGFSVFANRAAASTVLAMSAMPPAQNLVLLANVSPNSREIAPMLARLTLQLYLLSAPFAAAWVALANAVSSSPPSLTFTALA